MKHFKHRITAMVLVLAVCVPMLVTLSSCSTDVLAYGRCNIRAAVYGSDSDNAYNQLRNGIMANISVTRITDTHDIDEFDIIYLDSDADKVDKKAIEEYVNNGGTVVLDNR